MLSKAEFVSLKFKTETGSGKMSIRMWEGNRLIGVGSLRCGRDVPIVKSQFAMISKCFNAVSEGPNFDSC